MKIALGPFLLLRTPHNFSKKRNGSWNHFPHGTISLVSKKRNGSWNHFPGTISLHVPPMIGLAAAPPSGHSPK